MTILKIYWKYLQNKNYVHNILYAAHSGGDSVSTSFNSQLLFFQKDEDSSRMEFLFFLFKSNIEVEMNMKLFKLRSIFL